MDILHLSPQGHVRAVPVARKMITHQKNSTVRDDQTSEQDAWSERESFCALLVTL